MSNTGLITGKTDYFFSFIKYLDKYLAKQSSEVSASNEQVDKDNNHDLNEPTPPEIEQQDNDNNEGKFKL